MTFISVCCQNIGVFSLQQAIRKFSADLMGFFIGNFTRGKCLNQMKWVMKAMRLFLWTWKIINRNWKRGNEFKPECSIAGERWEAKEKVSALRSVNRYILEEFSQGNSGWYKNTSAETVTEEILSSGIGKKYLDTIIKRLAGLYTNREDIVNRFALLSGIVGRFRRAFVQMMKQ